MGGRSRRVLVAAVVAALAAARGDGGTAATAPPTTGAGTPTTAAWGQAVAPGAEAMLEGSRVLLREDFQDGETAGWQVDAGWFILENGERRMPGSIVCLVPGQPAGSHDWGVAVDSEREVDESDLGEHNNSEWHQLQV